MEKMKRYVVKNDISEGIENQEIANRQVQGDEESLQTENELVDGAQQVENQNNIEEQHLENLENNETPKNIIMLAIILGTITLAFVAKIKFDWNEDFL